MAVAAFLECNLLLHDVIISCYSLNNLFVLIGFFKNVAFKHIQQNLHWQTCIHSQIPSFFSKQWETVTDVEREQCARIRLKQRFVRGHHRGGEEAWQQLNRDANVEKANPSV